MSVENEEIISTKIPKELRYDTEDLNIKGTIERHNLLKEDVNKYKLILKIDKDRLDYFMGVFKKTCLRVFEEEETEDIMNQVFTDCGDSKKITFGFIFTFLTIYDNKGKHKKININEPEYALHFEKEASVILNTTLIAKIDNSFGSLETIKELRDKRILDRIKNKNKEARKIEDFLSRQDRAKKLLEEKEIKDKIESLKKENEVESMMKALGSLTISKGKKEYRVASYINKVTFTDKSIL